MVACALTLAARAEAASLQQVNNWGVTGPPSDVTMWIYVPDRVAANLAGEIADCRVGGLPFCDRGAQVDPKRAFLKLAPVSVF